MIDTASSAMQEMIQEGASVAQSLMQEGGHQVRTGIWLVSVGAQAIAVWFMNFLQRYAHGNTARQGSEAVLAEMSDDHVTWRVAGSTGNHKVRVSRSGAGSAVCACREYVKSGQCGHIEKAMKAHKRLMESGLKVGSETLPLLGEGRSLGVRLW